MIHCDDEKTRDRADINTLNQAVVGIWQVVEAQQELIRILGLRVTALESKRRWWRKRA